MTIQEIKEMCILSKSNKRHDFNTRMNETYVEATNEYGISYEKEMKDLGDQILERLKKDFDDLSFELIFDELTKLGQAPNLLYDDNGHFAVSGTGMQSVCMEDDPEDTAMTCFVEKKEWKDTIREALKHYLFADE